MTNILNLELITGDKRAKEVLVMGMKRKIQVFVIDKQTSRYRLLSPAHLTMIYQAMPDRTRIVFEQPICNQQTGKYNHFGIFGDYGFQDLWIDHAVYQDLFNKSDELSPQSETTHLNIIGVLVDTILATTARGQKISCFDSQATLIEYLLSNYLNIQGISKSTLENKFSKANKSIS